MSDSKSGSKNDLNESNMPLLDDEKTGETPEKEQIELSETEKDDSNEKEKKGDKKKKEKKEKKPKGPGCIELQTKDLNLKDRDEKSINVEIDLAFEDVIAEPDNAQGLECVWRLSFVLFTQTKLWVYRIIAAIIAVPLSLLWAVVFGLVTVGYVWFTAPLLRLVEFNFFILKRVWGGFVRAALEPYFNSFGAIFSRITVNQKNTVQQV